MDLWVSGFAIVCSGGCSGVFPPVTGVGTVATVCFRVNRGGRPEGGTENMEVVAVVDFFIIFVFGSGRPSSCGVYLSVAGWGYC